MTPDDETAHDASTWLPAEWEPHQATWLSWPHNATTWPGVHGRIPGIWATMIRALREGEDVIVAVPDEATAERIQKEHDLGAGRDVRFVDVPTNDAWVRDYGPIVTRTSDGERRATVWRFNAWGGKYPPWDADAGAGRRLATLEGLEIVEEDLVLEGGSIDVDGGGNLLTTEACLLDAGRNPGWDRRALEERLRLRFGVTRVLWLGDGIDGDDTDGHVDDLTRFVGPETVVTVVESDPRDVNYRPLRENRERLRELRAASGRPLEVIELPMPEAVIHEGLRCPASYANFFIGNSCVLLPVFRCPQDAVAVATLAELFPSRRVVPIDCRDVVLGLGALHCVTQQLPTP